MPLPSRVEAYPPAMLAALQRTLETGGFLFPIPPSLKPKAVHLRFMGLLGALRKTGRSELANVIIRIQADPPALVFSLPENDTLNDALLSALGDDSPQTDESAEAALKRILGE